MALPLSPSTSYLAGVLYSGRVRIVTSDGETYVSKGKPALDRVMYYLGRGMSPKGSAKWSYAGKASHEDMVAFADELAAAGRPSGCEYCDGEGGHAPHEPCGSDGY